jgi:hypothetical protein
MINLTSKRYYTRYAPTYYRLVMKESVVMSIPQPGVSTPEAVRQILLRNYPIYECLKMRLINYHSLAEHVQAHVEEVIGRKTSINTLVVAIKRFADGVDEIKIPDSFSVLENARISLSSGIVDVTIKAHRSQFSKILRNLTDFGDELSEFPNIFPLATSIKMILPAEDYDAIRGKLNGLTVAQTRPNVAKLTLYLSLGGEMTPGISSYITELLYRNGVNIIDAFLGYGDIIMVVEGRDGPLAYDILQREIHTQK